MTLQSIGAPARRFIACAGVLLLCGACEKAKQIVGGRNSRILTIGGDTIKLPSGVKLHDIDLVSGSSDFKPATINVRSGDVVRFTTGDSRTHALVITPPNDAAGQLLSSTSQRRSPPLVSRGTAWVVSLKGAPAGTYVVSCISHAGTASIVVQ